MHDNSAHTTTSPPLACMKATPTPPHPSRHASQPATARPHHPCNSLTPSCPTWSPPHPLPPQLPPPQLHHLHLNTVAATTSTTSTPPLHPLQAHQPPRCTHPHMGRRHTLLPPKMSFPFYFFSPSISNRCRTIATPSLCLPLCGRRPPSPSQPR